MKSALFKDIYRNRRVLVTGHTGFKGSWLSLWLTTLGAQVVGYALEAPTNPNHFHCLDLHMDSVIGDVRDREKLDSVMREHQPEIVFHLAAQAMVRPSYENPLETWETNLIGSLKIFEACRRHQVRAIVNITSDKAYENREWVWGYRESDRLGGFDPYSASKACAEILTSSYRNSFFPLATFGVSHHTLLASCRAGNVIGGGDWAKDRLMVDLVTAASRKSKAIIRNPKATRPWQHVLEPLSGYLCLGRRLLEGEAAFAEAWNFGPEDCGSASVEEIVTEAQRHWPDVTSEVNVDAQAVHEAHMLRLDCSKARECLNWQGIWDYSTAVERTINWYKSFYLSGRIDSRDDLNAYTADAGRTGAAWTS